MHPHLRPVATLALALALHATVVDAVFAATLSFVPPAGGSASLAANWNPAQVPTTSDSCLYNLNSQYEVSYDASTTQVRGQLVNWGDTRINAFSPHTVTGRIHVGRTAAQACTLTLRQAEITQTGGTFVGTSNGTSGVLKIQSNLSQLTVQGVQPIRVGDNGGSGTLIARIGGVLQSDPQLAVGWNGGTGIVRVDGVSSADSSDRSRMHIVSPNLSLSYFGNVGGAGRLEVINGAWAEFDRAVTFGLSTGSTGELHVGGASTRDSARAEFHEGLNIGHNDGPLQPGGGGTATVAGGGVVVVDAPTIVGDDHGSDLARLNVRANSRMQTRGLYLQGPNADLNHTGGRLQITGNSFVLGDRPLVVNGNQANPKLDLMNVTQCTVTSATSPAMRIGSTGSGELRILSSSDVHVAGFNALVGDSIGANGNLEVTGNSSTLTVDDVLLVGRAGTGTMLVNQNADVICDQLGVGTQPTGDGSVVIENTGSLVRVLTDLQLAGLSTGASGAPGSILVNNDAELRLEGTPTCGTIWGTGELTVNSGSQLTLSGTLVNRGRLAVTGAEVDGGTIQPVGGGTVTGWGTVASPIVALLDTTGSVTALNTLALGDAANPLGIAFAGLLDVGAQAVTLADADSAVLGTVAISGGTLTAPAGGLHVLAGRRLRGTGTIDGNVRPAGRLIATTSNGLTLKGLLLNTGQGVNGTKFRFASGASFVGNGVIDASVVVDSGATILPTGALTLGDAQAASSVTVNGVLFPGPGVNVTLDGTDTTRVDGRVQLSGGVLIPSFTPVHVRPAGTLSGNGGVSGITVLAGTLDPGLASRRKLSFEQLRMRSTGRIVFDVGSIAAGQRDTIDASSIATLAGTLDLRLGSGFSPAPGDSFLVVSAPVVTGTFSTFTVGGQPAAGQFELRYRSNAVWAVVSAPGLDAPRRCDPVISSLHRRAALHHL